MQNNHTQGHETARVAAAEAAAGVLRPLAGAHNTDGSAPPPLLLLPPDPTDRILGALGSIRYRTDATTGNKNEKGEEMSAKKVVVLGAAARLCGDESNSAGRNRSSPATPVSIHLNPNSSS
jgi:hypothetical protein